MKKNRPVSALLGKEVYGIKKNKMTCKGKHGHNFTIRTMDGYKCSECGILQSELLEIKKPEIKLSKPDKRKIDYSFQLLGLDMAEYYGKEKQKLIFSLFYKHSEIKLRDAFEVCKKRGVKSINYMLGIIKKL